MESVPNAELHLADLPAPDADWQSIWRLALSFNGYHYWGSFDQCAKIANQERSETLTELRTCLFFECQRWRHFGDDPDEEAEPYIRGLVAKIREKVAQDCKE